MQKYIGSALKNELVIKRLYSVHYFEYSNTFKFDGESHDFWEFVYIDRGEVTAVADNKRHTLTRGNVIFHKPGERHGIASGNEAANVTVVSFGCDSPAMNFFENKIIKCGQNQKVIISKIISEYTAAFMTPPSELFSYTLKKKPTPAIGAQQLLKQYICEFLFSLMRTDSTDNQHTLIYQNQSDIMLDSLIEYMNRHISQSISIDDMVHFSGSNRTSIYNLFKDAFGIGPAKYFIRLKTETAKKYLREQNYNVTQISEMLGYSGIHYFSRRFKAETGMSPMEYSNSVKAMAKLG